MRICRARLAAGTPSEYFLVRSRDDLTTRTQETSSRTPAFVCAGRGGLVEARTVVVAGAMWSACPADSPALVKRSTQRLSALCYEGRDVSAAEVRTIPVVPVVAVQCGEEGDVQGVVGKWDEMARAKGLRRTTECKG